MHRRRHAGAATVGELDSHPPDLRGWTICDVLADDAAGRRLLARGADGATRQLIEPPEDAQRSLAFRERFKDKAARAQAVQHECVVPTLGFAEDAGKLFLLEADVAGVPLAELIEPRERLETDALLEVGEDIARALGELHRRGVIHGWVRPAAILVTQERALLRECGLEHPKGSPAGEPDFMSPEQLSDNRSLRPESDFFSLGSTLFAAVVGRPPFVGATPEDVARAISEGHAAFPGPGERLLGKGLALLLAKLLAPDPERRPRSAEELVEDIEAVRRGGSIRRVTERPPPPLVQEAAPKPPRRRLAIAAAFAAVAALVAVAVVWLTRDKSEHVRASAAGTSEPARLAAPATTTEPAREIEPEPEADIDREKLARDLYDEAEAFARANPLDLAGALRNFQDVEERFPGTRAAVDAKRRATEIAIRKDAARLADFNDVQAEADQLVKEKRFGAAIELFRRHEELRSSVDGQADAALRERVARQVGFVRAAAAEAFARESQAAAEAARAGRYAEAVAIYEVVAARYGIGEFVERAGRELGLLRPLLAEQEKEAAARKARELEQAYDEAAAHVRESVRAFDFDRAVADAAELAKRFGGTALAPSAARHVARLRRLLVLKQRVIDAVNKAEPKLSTESVGLRASTALIAAADADGVTLRSEAGDQRLAWAALSDWEKYAIARRVSDVNSPDDLAALGLLSLELGNLARAETDLDRAKRLGADVDELLSRLKKQPSARKPGDAPARMLVEARALVVEKKWLDALALLIPLKEKHATSDYAIRAKLDEINNLLERCTRGLARSDIDRDIAAGVETDLLANGIDGWSVRGTWTLKDGRVACDNTAEHDVEVLTPGKAAPAYRLWVRCRVLAGNGLLIRVASDGDRHYDFWLGLGDAGKTGLWFSADGKIVESKPASLEIKAGEWVEIRAAVTGRGVRVECGGRSVALPNRLDTAADAKRFYGFITRQKSKAEFGDFRLRILREQ